MARPLDIDMDDDEDVGTKPTSAERAHALFSFDDEDDEEDSGARREFLNYLYRIQRTAEVAVWWLRFGIVGGLAVAIACLFR